MKKVVKSSSAVLIFKVIYVFNAKISGNCLSRINFLYFVSFTYLVIMIFIVVFKMKCQKAATEGVLLKKVFLEISQNSQENTCARDSFLIKLQALGLVLYNISYLWTFPTYISNKYTWMTLINAVPLLANTYSRMLF